MTYKVLISDKFDAEGVSRLKNTPNFEVIYKGGHSKEELLKDIEDVDCLIVRSATKVKGEVFEHAKKLKLIVRAGVGVDNIDISEASRRGIIVMNAPGGSSITTAEHAIALMFALARNIPQANQSMKQGKWEKSKFLGIELMNKTLGVIGLGRIGREVVKRAKGLQMKVLGYDPYINREHLSHLEIEIVDLDTLLEKSDIITVHTPLTETTQNLINKQNLHKLKKGVRLINCARGGIYDEEALVEGLKSGHIGGVALDVFSQEPIPPNFPLIPFENCIMTPHLGASTAEAEFAVAMETIDEVIEFFTKGIARNAINFPSMDPEDMDYLKPYFIGAEKVGKLLANLIESPLKTIQITYNGEIAKKKVEPIKMGIVKGALSKFSGDENVNFVNALVLAKERGIRIIENFNESTSDFISSVDVQFENDHHLQKLKYTVVLNKPIVVKMDGFDLEFEPEGILLIIQNRDVPGVIGSIGTFLGKENINIASLELSRTKKGELAKSVIKIDDLLTKEQLEAFQKLPNILFAKQVDLR
ncbi:MAG: phosphoglycerate dehydrogenase [Leptospiraceae bacterium]|nr:phosphoglycerate dehydrogenase [Leptospiraceae bacterium]MDW7975924.1 phosphoglycerate dehydrogenase [Leptospiraceae bacterium]